MIDGSELLARLPAAVGERVDLCGRLAAERGDDAYLVGGGVRDLLLGLDGVDVDVVVVGDGLAVAQALARSLGGELTRYHAFQTARVDAPDGLRIDVATARSEDYPRPGQLPRVREGTLQEDLARRDFTINAMAVSVTPEERGGFVDPFDGRGDLERGLVRFLHERSFADDPTRILRALRFAVRLGYRLEERTEAGLEAAVHGRYLDEISGPRLRREVRKMLGEAPMAGSRELERRGVLPLIHPGLRAEPERLRALLERTDRLDPEARFHLAPWSLVLAVLGADLAPQQRWVLTERLRLTRQQRRALIAAGKPWERARRAWERDVAAAETPGESPAAVLLSAFDDVDPGGLIIGAALAAAGGEARLAADVERYLRHLREIRPRLGGDELVGLGCPPGPAVGELLAALRAAVAEGEVKDREEERRWVARRLEETS